MNSSQYPLDGYAGRRRYTLKTPNTTGYSGVTQHIVLLIIIDVLWNKSHRSWFDRRLSAFDPSLPTSLPKGERRQLFPFSTGREGSGMRVGRLHPVSYTH